MRFKIILTILAVAFLCNYSRAETNEARDAFLKGYQLFEEGNNYSAITQFKSALQDPSYPLLDYGYYYVAKAYHQAGNREEALQVYEFVPKYFKNSLLAPKALFGAAQIQADLKNPSGAISTLKSLIDQFPKHELIPEARFMLGYSLEKIHKYEDAARVYRNIDLLHPNSAFAEKALEQLDQLAKQSPLAGYEAQAATIYNLGIKIFNRKNYPRSKEYFNRIVNNYRKSSFYDEALIMLGRIHLRKNNLTAAVKCFKKNLNLNKDSKPEAMLYLAITYNYMESPNAAISTLNKIVSDYPSAHIADDALFYLGRYYLDLGQTDYALRSYENLLLNYPNSDLFADALWMVGNIYYKQKNYAQAYDQLIRVTRLPSESVSDKLIFWTAKCAEKSGRTEEAVSAYKMTISRFDHSYYSYRAREELQKYGINITPDQIPDVLEITEGFGGNQPESAEHEEKYRELMALGLGDEAAEEADCIEQKAPVNKKEKVEIAKYHAYVAKGKFSKPIYFAERRIEKAIFEGNLPDIDPRLWRFSYPRGYWQLVEKYSKKYGLDPFLTYAVIREESRFSSRALSRARACGLMQIIPSTGRKICSALGMRYSRWKMYDPNVNIQMGCYFLSRLIKRFDGNVSYALAGYNGGPNRVEKWIKKYSGPVDIAEFVEDIPFKETRNYVKKVLRSYYGYKRTYSGG